jgi:histone deacetylase 1/2
MVSLTKPAENPYEPTDYQDAITREDVSLWREKMDEEIQALTTKETWTLAPLPPGRKAIKCKFVYKFKPGYEGVADRSAVRLVAKGYSQAPGIDYSETFAPVVKKETFRLAVVLAVNQKLQISSLDVWVAFLNGDIQEDIYMDQPQGYIDAKKPNKNVCCENVSMD